MARRLQRQPVAAALAALLLAPAGALAQGSLLASYGFDDDSVASGPDTFSVFRGAKGHVRLSSAFRYSGYRSVEVHDVPADGDFPELQGFFPARSAGRLFFHFALLTSDPRLELNVALAGPRFFSLERDGIAFWLATRGGELVHFSDSIQRRLFDPEAFVWYLVDVDYDVAAGRYDLTIRREGWDEPLVQLRGQPGAAAHAGSAVDKFSFVGDPARDASSVTYYVDDVVIASDAPTALAPFAAPGRRKLFVDAFAEYQRLLQEKPRCLPALDPGDLGLSDADMLELRAAGGIAVLERTLAGEPLDVAGALRPGAARWRSALEAVADWSAGCGALEKGELPAALRRFRQAAASAPHARGFALSEAVVLAALRRFGEADERLAQLAPGFWDDPRYAVASAYVGVLRGDLERAEAWLRDPAARVLDRDANPLAPLLGWAGLALEPLATARRALGDGFRDALEETLIAEQYYYVGLWQGRYAVARDYALRMAERLGRGGQRPGVWPERAGDAALFARSLREARELYEQARRQGEPRPRLDLKLADVAFLEGDLPAEQKLRERYYGGLHE